MIKLKGIYTLGLSLILFACSANKATPGYRHVDRCHVLSTILKIDDINNFIENFDGNYSIRINDLSKFFKNIERCSFNRYSLRIIDKLSADLNTGRYIDLTILSVDKKPKDTLNVKVFFAPKVVGHYRDKLMIGEILINVANGQANILESKIGYFD